MLFIRIYNDIYQLEHAESKKHSKFIEACINFDFTKGKNQH